MSVVALETDREQLAALRSVVCNLVGTRLTVVDSIDHLLQALQSTTPDVILLPALIPPGDESALIEYLRTVPHHAHIETLITPVLRQPSQTVADRGWLPWSGRRGAAVLTPPTDPMIFAERLRWSLEVARERRTTGSSALFVTPSVESRVASPSSDLASVDAPHSLIRLLNEAAVEMAGEAAGLVLSETATRMLEKMNGDRRLHRRFAATELHGIQAARIRSGPQVALIDVSAGGALLESDARLQPESEAMLELIGAGRNLVVPFRVLRCQVASLGQSTRYRGACAFKTLLNVSDLIVDAHEHAAIAGGEPDGRLLAANAW